MLRRGYYSEIICTCSKHKLECLPFSPCWSCLIQSGSDKEEQVIQGLKIGSAQKTLCPIIVRAWRHVQWEAFFQCAERKAPALHVSDYSCEQIHEAGKVFARSALPNFCLLGTSDEQAHLELSLNLPDSKDVHGLRPAKARLGGFHGWGGGGRLWRDAAQHVRVLTLSRLAVLHVMMMVVVVMMRGRDLSIVQEWGGLCLLATAGGVQAFQRRVHIIHQGF